MQQVHNSTFFEMIDFVKFTITQVGILLKLKSELTFEKRLTKNNNVVWSAWYKNMLIEIFEPTMTITVSGSLHYLKNDGMHNWNDFTRLELFDTVIEFCNRFGLDPKKTILHGFEFGLNVNVPFEPSFFIERVLAYKKGKIEQLTAQAEQRDAIKICFDQYRLKIYNKSKQFAIDSNILRFEVKITRMAKVAAIGGLNTLHDLLKPKILQKLGRILLSEFKELIISEPMDLDRMTDRELATFEQMNDTAFWESITNKSMRRDKKNRFRCLTAKYGSGLHNQVSTLINEKWSELIEWQAVEDKQKHRTFSQGGVHTEKPKIDCQLIIEGSMFAPINHLYI